MIPKSAFIMKSILVGIFIFYLLAGKLYVNLLFFRPITLYFHKYYPKLLILFLEVFLFVLISSPTGKVHKFFGFSIFQIIFQAFHIIQLLNVDNSFLIEFVRQQKYLLQLRLLTFIEFELLIWMFFQLESHLFELEIGLVIFGIVSVVVYYFSPFVFD